MNKPRITEKESEVKNIIGTRRKEKKEGRGWQDGERRREAE